MNDVTKTNYRVDYKLDAASGKQVKRSLSGIFEGLVVDNEDESRAGRIRVYIEALDGTLNNKNTHVNCQWTSPFAGTTDIAGLGTDITSYEQTQTSYGMWMIPPDVGNKVLVGFANGNPKKCFVISCVFPDRYHHMVPGIPSGKSYSDPDIAMPVAEKNRRDEKQTHNDAIRPAALDLARGLVGQGLINDPLRGAGTSGSRRDKFGGEVYGILTPGPRDKTNPLNRLGGHSFVMDDSQDSSLIRLRSRGGNQLLLDDTTGSIYMINKRGNAWFELASNGDINLFSEGSINMRSEGNLNLRADKNINIEAGKNVYVKAAGDRSGDGDYAGIAALGSLGFPPLGTGGNIRFNAAGELTALGQRGAQITSVGGDIDFSAAGRIANSGAKFDVFTAGVPGVHGMGISMLSTNGAFQASGILGATVSSTAITAIQGLTVQLNSAPAVLPIPALPAIAVPPLGTNKFKDAPVKPPEWKEPSKKKATPPKEGEELESTGPEPLAPTGGERTGKQDEIETIVTAMPTKEPYSAHYSCDPIAQSEQKPSPAPDALEKLPEGASEKGATKPDDVQTPEGTDRGTTYVDKEGNPISSVNEAWTKGTDAASNATKNASELMDAASDPAGFAKAALEGNPVYDKTLGILNNFTTMNGTKLLEIMGLGGMIAGIKAAIPPIRFPTANAYMEKIIGLQKEISALQAELSAFGLDQLGFDLELLKGQMGEMQGLINDAVAMAKDAEDLKNILESHGITMPVDGEMIFEDKFGNKLVDFSGGIGPVGATLGLISDINKTYDTISSDLKVPLHDHGKLAITSFANSISPEVFAGSRVAILLNNPDQHKNVAREMQKWVLDKPGGKIDQVLVGLRRYESELFQSPDEMDINLGDLPEGGVPWSVLADMLKAKREEFYVKKTSEDGPA